MIDSRQTRRRQPLRPFYLFAITVCPSFSSLPVYLVSLSLSLSFPYPLWHNAPPRRFSSFLFFHSFPFSLFHPIFRFLRLLCLSLFPTQNETRVERKWERVGADGEDEEGRGKRRLRDDGRQEGRRGQTSRSDERVGVRRDGERSERESRGTGGTAL